MDPVELELLIAAHRTCCAVALVAGITTGFVTIPGTPHTTHTTSEPLPSIGVIAACAL